MFAIQGFHRGYLVFELIAPLALLGIVIWAVSDPHLRLKYGPLGLIPLAAWAAYSGYRLFKWFNFRIEIGDEGIRSGSVHIPWSEVRSARAKTAIKFDTFIVIAARNGAVLEIPAAIQHNALVLSTVEKHVPHVEKTR